MKKTTHEIIDEVANFYNLGNRSTESNGLCMYNGPDGKQCAFARICIDPTSLREGENARAILYFRGDEIIKPEYRGYDHEFYRALQYLHDRSSNWTYEGLSDSGLDAVKSLKEDYPVK